MANPTHPMSERGYLLRLQNEVTSHPDKPLDVYLMREQIMSNAGHLADTCGQHVGNFAARASAEITVVGSDVNNQVGEDYYAWKTSLGPFPLPILSDGRPAPVRVVGRLHSTSGSVTVYAAFLLRHEGMGVLEPVPGDLVVDGWNLGYIRTAATSATKLEANVRSTSYPDGTARPPMYGFLQFPPHLWPVPHSRFERRTGAPSGTVDYEPATVVMGVIDVFMGYVSGGVGATGKLSAIHAHVSTSAGIRSVDTK